MVKQNNATLVSGNTFAYGNAASKLFTIQNFGISANLRVDSIVITGTNAADFSIGAFDSITPFNNETDTFSVYFNPSANGSRFATLKIYSTDSDRNPFDVNLYGVGGQFATEPANQVGAVNISNVKTHTLNVSFSRATGAEKYILLRKTGASITEVPVDGTTYLRGDYIGNAQVAYIGDDTTLLRPNYILANTTYSFAAFAFNGPAGFENYNTTSAPSATATTQNGTPGNYYNNVDTNSFNFVTALGNRVRTPHDTIFYSNYTSTVINNYMARDTSMGRKVVECVYTGLRHVYEDPFIWWNGNNSGTLTREHTFAQSWMPSNGGVGSGWPEIGGKEVLEYNDLHNLFPAHQTNANAKRSNNPFGIVTTATYTSPTGFGKLGTNANGITVYEPRDEQKGDLARALFYMLVRYNGERNNQWRLPADQDINLLLQWHQQDPPSPVEIARNEYIFSIQKNRNPFIDNPTWVNRINFATMTSVPHPSAVIIDLTAPNGGATYMVGSTQNITWNQQNIDTVVIEYRSAATAPWIMITDTVPGVRGTYSWTIPNTVTTTARVRVSNKANSTIADSSTSNFRIDVPRSVNITYPTAGETWVRGKFYTVTWNQQNLDTLVVQIQTTAGPYTTLGRVAAANGAYTFNLTSIPTTTARVRVIDPTNLTMSSISSTFNIVQSAINITTVPDSTWEGNQTKTISWNKTFVDTVEVKYTGLNIKTNTFDTIIIANNITADSFTLTLPNVFSNITVWVKEVSGLKTPTFAAFDTLNSKINLITITYPKVGETWVRGKYYTVTWNQQNLDSLLVQIQIGATPFTTIGSTAAVNGSYKFNLTSVPTTTARIRVINPNNSSISSVSGTFNIVQSAINITTVPDSTWEGNQTKTISWTKSYTDTVELKYIGLNTQTNAVDTITVANNITADSFNLTLPNLYSNITLWVKEASVVKNPTYTAFDTLNFNIRLVNSLNKNDLINQLVNVYPVPSNGVVFVNMPSNVQLNKIEIFDVTGKLVDTTASTQLNINHKGLYIIKVTTQQGVATKRVVIE